MSIIQTLTLAYFLCGALTSVLLMVAYKMDRSEEPDVDIAFLTVFLCGAVIAWPVALWGVYMQGSESDDRQRR